MRDEAHLRPWLVSVAANEAKRVLRQRRRRSEIEVAVDATGVPGGRDPASGVAAIDLGSANTHLLSDSNTGSGTNLGAPSGIVVTRSNPRALVCDSLVDALFAIDLQTGDRKVVSSGGIGAGTVFTNPRGISLDETNNRVLLVDSDLAQSRGDAKRAVGEGGVYLNGERVTEPDREVGAGDLLHDSFLLLRRGKKRWHVAQRV